MTAEFTPAHPRTIVRTTRGVEATDGAGVNMRRIIHQPELEMLDPFLMLDWFHSDEPQDYLAGFPNHPHRGFETVTYLMHGRMRHWDNKGHEGVIEPGGIQWMTAAGGIIHSEMPEQEDGLLSGFQLWVNLPAALKMKPAGYQEFDSAEVPVEEHDGVSLRVITGRTAGGTEGPVRDISTEPFFADIHLKAGAAHSEPVAEGHAAFLMVHEGTLEVAGSDGTATTLEAGDLAVLGDGDGVTLTAGPEGAKTLLVAARPLREPVARGGPFVMNTREEIMQAFDDYRAGRL
ncbi:MAG: quercetin 2,3-dioxygenase [Hyphomicrobiales bacterium]|nr:MAG: quercetin 2,3-dioxygenase [Hyphomicrobiales bacterium]